MSNFAYKQAVLELESGVIDWLKDEIKVMLVDMSYKPDREDKVVSSYGPNSVAKAEISTDGYVKGYGKSGRRVLKTRVNYKLPNWMECKTDDPEPWTNLGPSNSPVGAAIVIKEGQFDDRGSRLIAYVDTVSSFPPFPFIPLGGKYALNIDKEGFLNIIIMEKVTGDVP